jgi:hypothetical protein
VANSGGGGEFKSDIRKQEKMKFVSVGHHHAAGLEYAMKEVSTYLNGVYPFCILGSCFLIYIIY